MSVLLADLTPAPIHLLASCVSLEYHGGRRLEHQINIQGQLTLCLALLQNLAMMLVTKTVSPLLIVSDVLVAGNLIVIIRHLLVIIDILNKVSS